MRLNCKRITLLLCKERGIVVPEEVSYLSTQDNKPPSADSNSECTPRACPNGLTQGIVETRNLPLATPHLSTSRAIYIESYLHLFEAPIQLKFCDVLSNFFMQLNLCISTYGGIRKSINNLLGFGVADYIIFFVTIYDIIFFNDHTLAMVTKMCLPNMIFSSRCGIYHPRI